MTSTTAAPSSSSGNRWLPLAAFGALVMTLTLAWLLYTHTTDHQLGKIETIVGILATLVGALASAGGLLQGQRAVSQLMGNTAHAGSGNNHQGNNVSLGGDNHGIAAGGKVTTGGKFCHHCGGAL